MQMTNTVAKNIPDRVMNFGSNDATAVKEVEEVITPDNLEFYAESLPRPTGYRILILPFTQSAVTKGGIHGARFQIEGGDMRLLNDDEILATIDDPEAILS